jgi:hypothetical protein
VIACNQRFGLEELLGRAGQAVLARIAQRRHDLTPAVHAVHVDDIECDPVTYGSVFKTVVWGVSRSGRVIRAFPVSSGDCGFGGKAPTAAMCITGQSGVSRVSAGGSSTSAVALSAARSSKSRDRASRSASRLRRVRAGVPGRSNLRRVAAAGRSDRAARDQRRRSGSELIFWGSHALRVGVRFARRCASSRPGILGDSRSCRRPDGATLGFSACTAPLQRSTRAWCWSDFTSIRRREPRTSIATPRWHQLLRQPERPDHRGSQRGQGRAGGGRPRSRHDRRGARDLAVLPRSAARGLSRAGPALSERSMFR